MNRPDTANKPFLVPLPYNLSTLWNTPRIDYITQSEHIQAQLTFWTHYSKTTPTWDRMPPERLAYRHSQIVYNTTKVLTKMHCALVSNRDLFELCMLQKGWDDLKKELLDFLSTNPPQQPEPPSWSQDVCLPSSRTLKLPQFLADYAAIDSNYLTHLYDNPPVTVHPNTRYWVMHPDRPPVTPLMSAGRPLRAMLGPILTNSDVQGEEPSYKCERNGCKGMWWFWTALKSHQEEVPHRVITEEVCGGVGLKKP